MTLKFLPALAVAAALGAQTGRGAEILQVRAVRHWSLAEATRVVIEVSGEFTYHTEQLHNPERVFFDIFQSRPALEDRRNLNRELEDKFLKKVRVAQTLPGVTRIVLDLQSATGAGVSQLSNPNRLVVELHPQTEAPADQPVTSAPLVQPPFPSTVQTATVNPAMPPPPVQSAKPSTAVSEGLAKAPAAPKVSKASIKRDPPAPVPPAQVTAEPSKIQEGNAGDALQPGKTTARNERSAPIIKEAGKAARHTSDGQNSLIRALGLKITRVVLDPGHGGHDQGTVGPRGLMEKDLVLDVARRLGKLIESRLGSEVIYTRTDDTFIPLEGRTALANDRKADLFLSIHANSSPVSRIAGVETFYLNFTDSQDALDVASRENAGSQKSVFELRDIIQKIAVHDKAEESREFAGRIQASLYSLSARNVPGAVKNRGVKKAPFVVLIGAHMPSVLAEIGFVSNPREESLLKRSDYRQKIAEALFRGLQRYAESLSHFQLAAVH